MRLLIVRGFPPKAIKAVSGWFWRSVLSGFRGVLRSPLQLVQVVFEFNQVVRNPHDFLTKLFDEFQMLLLGFDQALDDLQRFGGQVFAWA